MVLGALGLAHFIVDRTHPADAGVAARVHEGLLGWDAGCYETIARVGYGPLGKQSLRFFPAVPVLTHAVAWLPGVSDGAALLVVSNVAALVATVLLYVLVRRETGDDACGPAGHLVPQPGPGRLRPGHGLRRVDPALPGRRLLPGPAPARARHVALRRSRCGCGHAAGGSHGTARRRAWQGRTICWA